jgi:DNA-binding transcriptional ArsR family regulator
MNDDTLFEMEAEICHAMGNSSRLKIVHILQDGPQRVGDLARVMGFSQAALSRHLAVLRRAGVVTGQRRGQEVLYHLADPKIASVCGLMREVLSEQMVRRSEMTQMLITTHE